jgi:hypothetical protein
MLSYKFPTTAEIMAIATEEIAIAGGNVAERFDDGSRLFVRFVLPHALQVTTGDTVHGGVAVRGSGQAVSINPYVFRLVCRNGAIIGTAACTRCVEDSEYVTAEEVGGAIRAAVYECASKSVFVETVEQMRRSRETPAGAAINLLRHLSNLPPDIAAQMASLVAQRFFEAADQSRFDLMNAVTSVARDSNDPDLRWRLEELGGAIGVSRTPRSKGEISKWEAQRRLQYART